MTPTELKAIFADRQRAYQLAFKDAAGQAVLADLSIFCRSRETCVIPGDHDRTLVLEGRREVYLRIRDHLDLTVDQLVEIYTTPAIGAHGNELP